VLLSTVGNGHSAELNSDLAIYRNRYREVRTEFVASFSGLSGALENVDILHLYLSLDGNGEIVFPEERQPSTHLVEACRSAGVKLLIVASPNDPNAYLKGLNPREPRLNLMLTLDRKGELFSEFLDRLLHELAGGSYLPTAWTKLVPQAPGPWHERLPSSYLAVGLP
jgi:hypothetical protein